MTLENNKKRKHYSSDKTLNELYKEIEKEATTPNEIVSLSEEAEKLQKSKKISIDEFNEFISNAAKKHREKVINQQC